MTTEATDRPHTASRTAEARLARLHLRTGMLSLARAELETMAADGTLDTPALADLAEARWRSGDLPGAGDAAVAHLDAGGAPRSPSSSLPRGWQPVAGPTRRGDMPIGCWRCCRWAQPSG